MPERRALLENWLRSVLDLNEVVLAPASGLMKISGAIFAKKRFLNHFRYSTNQKL